MNKTLVTEAAGFIGSHVVRELLATNREVKAMILPGESTKNLDTRPTEESIRRAVDWYASNGYITNKKFLQQYKR